MSWFSRITAGLGRTASKVGTGLKEALGLGTTLDDAVKAGLEETLLLADVGPTATQALLKALQARTLPTPLTPEVLATELATLMAEKLQPLVPATSLTDILDRKTDGPVVIVMAGVNGAGKTTTLGKLAAQWAAGGHHVVVAAADTFRAAAVEQLKVWVDRAITQGHKGGTVEFITPDSPKADAASVAYRALEHAKANGADVVLIDTAGRLPNRADLLAELPKLARVLKKQDPTAPHHTFLVLDGTLGQSTLPQITQFTEALGADMPPTGLIVTKLDSSGKAGFLLALAAGKTPLPVVAMGMGETLADVGPFDPVNFARGLVGLPHA